MTPVEHFRKAKTRFGAWCGQNAAALEKSFKSRISRVSQKSKAMMKGTSDKVTRGKATLLVKMAACAKAGKASLQYMRAQAGKAITLCQKNSGVAIMAVAGLAGLFGLARLAVHNPDRGEPSVVFNEESRRIVVYHQKKKVYVETDNSRFVMMDYGRQMAAEGVLFQAPAWFVSGDRSVYSMQLWRQFNQIADQPGLAAKQKEYEKYIAMADAQIAAKGVQK